MKHEANATTETRQLRWTSTPRISSSNPKCIPSLTSTKALAEWIHGPVYATAICGDVRLTFSLIASAICGDLRLTFSLDGPLGGIRSGRARREFELDDANPVRHCSDARISKTDRCHRITSVFPRTGDDSLPIYWQATSWERSGWPGVLFSGPGHARSKQPAGLRRNTPSAPTKCFANKSIVLAVI